MQMALCNHTKKNTATIDTNKFRIYVTDDKYFVVGLTPFSIVNTSSVDYKTNLIAIITVYISTYVCRISTQDMEYNKNTPGIITSMVRYHLYYQVSKFVKDPSKLDRYISHVPYTIHRQKPTTPI